MKTKHTMRFVVFGVGLLLLALALAACGPIANPGGTAPVTGQNPADTGGTIQHNGGGAMKLKLLMPNYDHIVSKAIHPSTAKVRILTTHDAFATAPDSSQMEEFDTYTLPAPSYEGGNAAGSPVTTTVGGFDTGVTYTWIKVELLNSAATPLVLTEGYAQNVIFSASEPTTVYFFCVPSKVGFEQGPYQELTLNTTYNLNVARKDMNFYRIWLGTGNYTVTIIPSSLSDDPDMYLFNPQGQFAGEQGLGYTYGVSYVYTEGRWKALFIAVHSPTEAGYYYIGVYGYNFGVDGTTSNYLLTVSPTADRPPSQPSSPDPVDDPSYTMMLPTQLFMLDWADCTDPDVVDQVTYDVYLYPVDGGYKQIGSNLVDSYRDLSAVPITLAYDTTYLWYVVAKDQNGGVTTGPVWTFHTDYGSNAGRVANGNFTMPPSNDWSGQYSTVDDLTAHLNIPGSGDYIPYWRFGVQDTNYMYNGPFEFGIGQEGSDSYAILKDTAGSNGFFTQLIQIDVNHVVQAGDTIHVRFRVNGYAGGGATAGAYYEAPVKVVFWDSNHTQYLLMAYTLGGYSTDTYSSQGPGIGQWYEVTIPFAGANCVRTADYYSGPVAIPPGSQIWGVGIMAQGWTYDVNIATFEIVSAPNNPPVANFDADTTTILPGGYVNFNATASYDPDTAIDSVQSYYWYFEDGAEGYAGATPSHQYISADTYTVTLYAIDSRGKWSSEATKATKTITVGPGTGGGEITVW
jgi:hypothetical protein